ncbi:spore germination protein [Alicyclobacillus fastidiosus]|uniref:Spore germination protein n=2 Tax=Alicyclobacillus fastidiosus TaxID=392011 RepID=A0ABV5AL86_9BACL|nr:spore germination protein [Alicyclobacillus fastidiosus]WAH44926.1 spore germination protein [Alicyclobacillus fastidiosus]WEH10056.1 spore germination protein [Alicyclobacillus fastidiosus]GMA65690.1 spore germination protein [Alicyclobacillus fastidiosus]
MIEKTFSQTEEVVSRQVILGSSRRPRKVVFVYCKGMVDLDRFNRDILGILYEYFLQLDGCRLSAEQLEETLPIDLETTERLFDPLVPEIFRGHLVLLVDGIDVAYVANLSNPPNRQPEEPNTETSVRGPKDGFIEALETNVALIRKRLPTETLCTESFTIGVRTQSKVSLLYIRDIIDPSVLTQIRDRIQSIHVDAVYASAQLEEFLSDSKFFIVPMFAYSGRPDFVVGALLRGRFAIILDGTPTAIMGPTNMSFLLQSAEDEYISYVFLMLQRGLRFFGFLITLLLPGLYVAICTYHQEQIPLALLSTLATSRRGTPLPTSCEALLMLLMFELFREAGNRLPSKLGQTLTVVGGLVIGESAISAGMTSPTLLVVTATAAVASFTIPNQSLAGIIILFRFFILIVSSILGEFGFLISSFAVLVYLSTVRSFGIPYLTPFSPFHARDLSYTFNSVTAHQGRKRPIILRTKDQTRNEG